MRGRPSGGGTRRRGANQHVGELKAGEAALQGVHRVVDEVGGGVAQALHQVGVLRGGTVGTGWSQPQLTGVTS